MAELLISAGWVLLFLVIAMGIATGVAHLRLWYWRRKIRRVIDNAHSGRR